MLHLMLSPNQVAEEVLCINNVFRQNIRIRPYLPDIRMAHGYTALTRKNISHRAGHTETCITGETGHVSRTEGYLGEAYLQRQCGDIIIMIIHN